MELAAYQLVSVTNVQTVFISQKSELKRQLANKSISNEKLLSNDGLMLWHGMRATNNDGMMHDGKLELSTLIKLVTAYYIQI